MIFSKLRGGSWFRQGMLMTGALALAACAGTVEVDDTTGSHLAQPAPGTPPEPAVEAGDIAIAAQEFSHSVRELPQVAQATVPPLVQFNGVTSIIRGDDNQPVAIDTQPYTSLLRDRLLLGDREKLRFVERSLPPLTTHSRHGKHDTTGPIESSSADFKVLAELRGKAGADFYRIQIEFVDSHSGDVLFSAVYLIHQEAPGSSNNAMSGGDVDQQPIPQSPQVPPAVDPDRQSDTPAATGQYQPPVPPGRDGY